jgi:ferredoxin
MAAGKLRGSDDMKVWIDETFCTGSGLCQAIEPRVFTLGDDGLARVLAGDQALPPGPEHQAAVPADCEANVRDASGSCPGDCIRLEAG